MIRAEVAYATPQRQHVIALSLAPGTTLRAAIEQSGLLSECPELRAESLAVGVFGKPRGLDETVADGDRVEIYRPLLADPRAQRRRRARNAR